MVRRLTTTLLVLCLAGGVLAARAAEAPKLLRDYAFKKHLKDATGSDAELKAMNGTTGDGVYTFAAGQGLELAKPGVKDDYALEIVFKFDDVDSWQKVLDFKNRETDEGLYVYDGQLQFYDVAIGGQLFAGQEYTVRLERNSINRIVAAHLNGAKIWEFADAEDLAVFGDAPAYFFVDDNQTMAEQAGGAITRLRIWEGPNAAK